MKKHFRIMLAGVLALLMLLSFAACAKDKDKDDDSEKSKMKDIEDSLEDYAEDNEDKCTLIDTKKLLGKKVVVAAFNECGEFKGDIEACLEYTETANNDPAAWCLIAEFEKSADAKLVETEIVNSIRDFYFTLMLETNRAALGSLFEEMEEGIRIDIEYDLEEIIPADFTVERIDNVVFFGEKNAVGNVLEIIEDAE